MRSRLEVRWAAFLDALNWRWEYEPDLQAGYVIPDFILNFNHPVIIECKPALTIAEIADYRRTLITKMKKWLLKDVERELKLLDVSSHSTINDVDRSLDDLALIECQQNPRGHTRRALVVGPTLFVKTNPDRATVDGEYGFCLCCIAGKPDHVGLTSSLKSHCLLCGFPAKAWVPSSTILGAWMETGNAAQWRPSVAK